MKKLKLLISNKTIRKYSVYVGIFLLLIAFFAFFTRLFVFLLFLLGSVLAAFFLVVIGTNSIGIEFVTFPSVVFLFVYGWVDATIFGILSMFIFIFITRNMAINTFLCLPLIPILLAVLIPLKPLGIFVVGMTLAIIGGLILTVITLMFGTSHIHKRLIHFVTNVAWAWFLYGNFGEHVLRLLG